MTEKRTLLKRYEIPLHHLDFQYVKECNDPREMERIVHVLQSGEEGFYPDLTKCAEDKLRELKPNSRLFRSETTVLRGGEINESELKPIKEFTKIAHDKDKLLSAVKGEDDGLPPIRTAGKISLNKSEQAGKDNAKDVNNQNNQKTTSGNRIKSTDYRKWDSYDADVEILKMDLAEERKEEEIERKNRLKEKELEKSPLIEEIPDEEERVSKLTDIERENLAEEYRLRGNEYFRAKEYDAALKEYTRTINLSSEKDAAAFNNRAITYIKLKKYGDAIKDCEKCLAIEPNNIKALYRLAQSSMESGFKEKALECFNKVLELDQNHTSANNYAQTLRNQVGEKAPSNATRLRIEEGPTQANLPVNHSTNNAKILKKKEPKKLIIKKKDSNTEFQTKDYDLASLVRPKEIQSNTWMDTAANMIGKQKEAGEAKDVRPTGDISTKDSDNGDIKLRLPVFNETAKPPEKPLIEEL